MTQVPAPPAPPVIGGMFGLEGRGPLPSLQPSERPHLLRAPHHRLASGRSALGLLALAHRPTRVWLPSHHCEVVHPALQAAGATLAYFPVTVDLRPEPGDWVEQVGSGDLVVFITYFGFDGWSEVGQEVRARGAWVVEDACQALLNDGFSTAAHYVVASPRKFLGVPDGGILVTQDGPQVAVDVLPPPAEEWWLEAFRATRLRAEFDEGSGDRGWYRVFCQTEPAAPSEPRRMSELTGLLLDHAIDYPTICRRRRANYGALARELEDLALFPQLEAGVVPLGFPIRLANRDPVRDRLVEQEIFCPIHWPIPAGVPAAVSGRHRLASEILTLPCDQRLGQLEVERMVGAVRQAGARPIGR